jgi:hypothetical protein
MRKVEIFSAGCLVCEETIKTVHSLACPSCEVGVLDMHDPAVANQARSLGVRSVPAVVVDGVLAGCCSGRGPGTLTLQALGVGAPRP